ADGEDVRDVGAHLVVDFDEAAVGHRYAGLVGGNLLAVRAAAHGNQHEVVALGVGRSLLALELDPDTVFLGFGRDRLGLEHHVVEAGRIDLLPHLDQIAVGTLHQAVEHLDDVDARAQRGIHRGHLQPDDATADYQHALGHRLQFQRAGGVHHARVLR